MHVIAMVERHWVIIYAPPIKEIDIALCPTLLHVVNICQLGVRACPSPQQTGHHQHINPQPTHASRQQCEGKQRGYQHIFDGLVGKTAV